MPAAVNGLPEEVQQPSKNIPNKENKLWAKHTTISVVEDINSVGTAEYFMIGHVTGYLVGSNHLKMGLD